MIYGHEEEEETPEEDQKAEVKGQYSWKIVGTLFSKSFRIWMCWNPIWSCNKEREKKVSNMGHKCILDFLDIKQYYPQVRDNWNLNIKGNFGINIFFF